MTYKTPSDPAINVDDFTQPIEAVVAQERAATYPVPLKAQSYVDLFIDWLKANPKAAHEIEAVALGSGGAGLARIDQVPNRADALRRALKACCSALRRPIRR